MKKVAFLLCLIMFVFLCVACSTQTLATPQSLEIQDGILSWSKVEDASGYKIMVNDDEYTCTTSFYELTLQNNKDYQIKVKALGSGKFSDSDYSEILYYSNKTPATLNRLSAPNILEIDGLGNIHWSLVGGSCGYKIFKNNQLLDIVSDPYVTTYQLTETEMGTYSIQVQAIGDNVSFSDSAKSNIYKFVIGADGKPVLPQLSSPTITYNYKTESLEWSRVRYAVGYFVFLNDTVVAKIDATQEQNYSYQIHPNLSTNAFTVTALGDEVSYGMSKKSNSIVFPLVPMDPPQNIKIEVINNIPTITWDAIEYCRGYGVQINDKTETVLTNSIKLSGYTDGEYLVRIYGIGDDLFYTSTNYSQQISVLVSDGEIALPILEAPFYPRFVNNVLYWEAVEHAEKYEVVIEAPYDDTLTTTKYTSTTNQLQVDSVLSETVMIFYVRAFADGFATSPYSSGTGYVPDATKIYYDEFGSTVIVQGEQYYFIKTPSDIVYDGKALSWTEVDYASGYVINIDNQTFVSETNSLEYAINGTVVVSVSALTEKDKYYQSPKSVETIITNPKRLESPVPSLVGNTLVWDVVKNAESYILFVNGEPHSVNSTMVDLKSLLVIDGKYTLSVLAVPSDTFAYSNSLKSKDFTYVVDYGEMGTKEKPYLLYTYADFELLTKHPTAYFKVDTGVIDFEGQAITPLFVDDLFMGHFDGNNVVLKNFILHPTYNIGGFFGLVGESEIKNIFFDGVTMIASENAGILSSSTTDAIVQNITISNSSIVLSNIVGNIGGLFGTFSGEASNISININIQQNPQIAYQNGGNIGGFAGNLSGKISNVTLSGNIDCDLVNSTYVGGLSGNFDGEIDNLKILDMTIKGKNGNLGVVSGKAIAKIDNANVSGTILAQGGYVGVFGYFSGEFSGKTNAVITAQSSGNLYVGGFAGFVTNADIDALVVSKINVAGDFVYVGGFAGSASENIKYTPTEQIDIKATAYSGYIGGVYGYYVGEIQCDVSGTIELNLVNNEFLSLLVDSVCGNRNDMCVYSSVTLSGNAKEQLLGKPLGNGTNQSPYELRLAEHFSYFDLYPSACYILKNDIYLNNANIYSTQNPFCGVLDGNGKTLMNLNTNSGEYAGLFAQTNRATIKNINLKNICVNGYGNVGAVVGYALNTTFENVVVEGQIVASSGFVGGFVGFAKDCIFDKCGFNGDIILTSPTEQGDFSYVAGGFVGYNDSLIQNSFAIVKFTGLFDCQIGGFVGNNAKTITNCYATGKFVTSGTQLAGFVFDNQGSISNTYCAIESTIPYYAFVKNGDGITNSYFVKPTFVQPINNNTSVTQFDTTQAIESGIFEGWDNSKGYSLISDLSGQDVISNIANIDINVVGTLTANVFDYLDIQAYNWFGVGSVELSDDLTLSNGIFTCSVYGYYSVIVKFRECLVNIQLTFEQPTNPDFSSGIGTKEDPYIINSFADLTNATKYNANTYFKLGCDLLVTGTLENLKVNIDGDNHIVSSNCLVVNTLSGVITNIKFDLNNCMLAKKMSGATMQNVEITLSYQNQLDDFAAIGTIKDSVLSDINLNGSLSGTGNTVAGLACEMDVMSKINNMQVNLSISGEFDIVAGVVAITSGTIEQVNATLTLSELTSTYFGGIVAQSQNVISDCQVNLQATNTQSDYFGGISAKTSMAIISCSASIDIDISSTYAGGIVGYGFGVSDCAVLGNINVKSYGESACVGAIVGYAELNVNASFEGDVAVINSSPTINVGLCVGSAQQSQLNAKGKLLVNNINQSDTNLLMGAVGCGNVQSSDIQIEFVYNSVAATKNSYFGCASGAGIVQNSQIDIQIGSENIQSTIYIGGACGMGLFAIQSNTISGNICVGNCCYVGSLVGVGYNDPTELYLDNVLVLTIDAVNTNGEIGYILANE